MEDNQNLRKVRYYDYKRNGVDLERVLTGEAWFHGWGCDYEEFETGPGNYSTAIIELPNGKVENYPVNMKGARQ